MFLIEYNKDKFINGKYIDWLEIKNGTIRLTIQGDGDNIYIVDRNCETLFLNHLNCLNRNINNLEVK